MSSHQSASARRNKQLQELIDGNHFKQALSLCEKCIKKGDNTDSLLITLNNINLRHPDQAHRAKGYKDLEAILGRSHPISETEALVALNAAANARGDDNPRIQTIWERAVSVRPGDEDLYRTWFKTKFMEGKWTAAQKAAMMYMKKFPLSREPFFWNIITCELAGSHESATEIDRAILRPLAYKFISKAAADMSAEKPESSNVRTLKSLSDIFLLLKIYRSQGRYQEALNVLDDPLTGIASPLCNNSWELVRQKIELYELCQQWSEEWRFCSELLDDAHPDSLQNVSRSSYHQFGKFGDDWRVWVGLLSATDEINSSENSKITKDLIESYIKPRTVSRNARLALLRYYSIQTRKDAQFQKELLGACRQYFVDYCAKVICFRDLQPYVIQLDKPLQEKLLGLVARDTKNLICTGSASQSEKLEWVTSEINVLKLDYYLFVSLDRTPNRKALTYAFVRNCLRLYKVSLSIGITIPVSERRPGDDAAMLAVMALLQIEVVSECNVVFQCIAILEFLLADSKYNYDALLTLIRLYMNIGAGSLAVKLHSRLSVRNLQHATISWVLYTRISTILPFTPTKSSNQQPIDSTKNLSLAIDWHKSAEDLNSDNINRMLDDGLYSMLFDVLEVDRRIKNGLAKFMFVVESHRIGRLSNFSEMKDYSSLLDELRSRAEDTLDTTAFPDAVGDGEPRFEEYLTWAPKPDSMWLANQLTLIDLWGFLRTHELKDRTALEKALGTEKFNIVNYESCTTDEARATTAAEALTFFCHAFSGKNSLLADEREQLEVQVHKILLSLQNWHSSRIAELDYDSTFVEMVPFFLSIGIKGFNWLYFHRVFTYRDIFQLTYDTLEYLVKANSRNKIVDQSYLEEYSRDIRRLITLTGDKSRSVASAICNQLRKPGIAAKMIDNALKVDDGFITSDLKALIGAPGLEEIAANICSSWIEGLEGVARTKPR